MQNPEVVGTTLKTVSMYLRAAKTDAEAAGEATDGMANSVSELRDELLLLTSNRVDIMLDDSTFKNTYQITKEIASVWDSISDVDRANILELIGGKRNATAVSSLLTNFKDVDAALKTAQNSAGSAAKENEKFLDSIEGRLSKLEATFEGFSNHLLNSGLVKGIVSFADGALQALDALQQIGLLLPGISAGVLAIGRARQLSSVRNVFDAVWAQKSSVFATAFSGNRSSASEQQIATTERLRMSVEGLNEAQRRYIVTQLQGKVATEELTLKQANAILATTGVTKAEEGLVVVDGKVVAANEAVGTSFRAMFMSNPVGWIMMAVSALASLAQWLHVEDWFKSGAERLQELNDEFENLSQNIKSATDEFKNLNNEARDVIPRFVELAQGVNAFGENKSLSTEDYEEFLQLNNQLAELFPELDLGITAEGNNMLALAYNSDTLRQSLENLLETQRRIAAETIRGSLDEQVSNVSEQQNIVQKRIDALEEAKRAYDRLVTAASDGGNNNNQAQFERLAFNYDRVASQTDAYMRDLMNVLDAVEKTGAKLPAAYKELISNYRYMGGQGWNSSEASEYFLNETGRYLDNEMDFLKKYAEDEMSRKWASVMTSVMNSLPANINYSALSNDMKNMADLMVKSFDPSTLGDNVAYSDIETYIQENIIDPLYSASPEVQDAFAELTDFGEQAKDGEITVESFVRNVLAAFKQWEDELDPEVSERIFEMLRQGLNDAGIYGESFGEAMRNAALEFARFNDIISQSSLGDLVDIFSQISDGFDLVYDAISDTTLDGNISLETLKTLKDSIGDDENYLDYLKIEGDQVKLNTEAWAKRKKEIYDNKIAGISDENENLSAEIKKAQAIADLYAQSRDMAVSNEGKNYYSDLYKEQMSTIDALIKRQEDNIRVIELYGAIYKDTMDAQTLALDNLNSEYDVLKNSVSPLVDAYEALNDGESLSKENILELITLYPELISYYDTETGALNLQMSTLDALFEMQKQQSVARLKQLKAELLATTDIVEVYKGLTAYSKIMAGYASQGIDYTKTEDYAFYQSLLRQRADILSGAENYDTAIAFIENLTMGDFQSSSSKSNKKEDNPYDDLVNTYELIIKAIEAVADARVEAIEREKDALEERKKALEEQKDALEEQKDALDEANEAEERYLKLKQAQIDLANAYKKTTYIYKEGQGFVEVPDEKAIQEARKAVKEARTDIEKAELDKQMDAIEAKISAIEKQSDEYDKVIEAIEKYVSQFTDAQSDFENQYAINAATEILNTDSEGLLDLGVKAVQTILKGYFTALTKQAEKNEEYEAVDFDSFLKSFGGNVDASLLVKAASSAIPTTSSSALIGSAGNISTINNNSHNVIEGVEIYVNGARDPEAVASEVRTEIYNLFTKAKNKVIY